MRLFQSKLAQREDSNSHLFISCSLAFLYPGPILCRLWTRSSPSISFLSTLGIIGMMKPPLPQKSSTSLSSFFPHWYSIRKKKNNNNTCWRVPCFFFVSVCLVRVVSLAVYHIWHLTCRSIASDNIPRHRKLIHFNVSTIVPGDPQKVTVISVNSTAIRVEWKPPTEKEQYGIIRGYQIHVQEIDPKVRPSCFLSVFPPLTDSLPFFHLDIRKRSLASRCAMT